MDKPELLEALAFDVGPFHVGATVLTTWLLMALLAGLALLAVRRRRPTPGGRSDGAASGAPSGP